MKVAAAFLVASLLALQAAWALPAGDLPGGSAAPPAGRGVPAIAFTGPAATLLNHSLVEFRGTTADTDTVVLVEVSRDGVNWTAATDTGGAVPFSNWSCTLWLPEGTHNVTARANDTAGVENRATLEVRIDITAPLLAVEEPRKDFLTNLTMLPVNGRTEPGATVHVGTEAATVLPDGSFNHTTQLVAGTNLVEVRSRDQAGNEAVVAINGRLDAVAPFLNAWATVTLTNKTTVPVFGETEKGANVSVAGSEVPVGVLGNFSAGVELVPGLNQVMVSSHDEAGNYNFAIVEIVLDVAPPEVLITRPTGLEVVRDPLVEVCGTASDQSGITAVQVGVDDGNYSLAGGSTSWRGTVRLPAGTHNISVLVFDRAGNSNRASIPVTYVPPAPDRSPPALVISSPTPGYSAPERIRVSGQVSDPSGVSSVEVSLNNRTWRMATLDEAHSAWSANMTLHEGWNTIYVKAYDKLGNNGTGTVSVEYKAPAVAGPMNYLPYAIGIIIIVLVGIAAYTLFNFWWKRADQPEPGLGEDEAVVEMPAKGLK